MPPIAVVNSSIRGANAFALAVAATGTSIGSLIFPPLLQYLFPAVGFAWAVRCEGLVTLIMAGIATLLMKPYLLPRKSGPLLEQAAFRELPYILFTVGGFLNFYTLYFGFFYVSTYVWSMPVT